ncbi:hypothetical protein D3C80_1747280 [compost metagenome]
MGKRLFGGAGPHKLHARQQRQTQAAEGMQHIQTGIVVILPALAVECAAGAVQSHQQRGRRRQALSRLQACLEIVANLGHHLTQ